MRYIADLHIHSYYSRATSKELNLEHLNKWAQIKGLKVVATGDITHPGWLEEIQEKLEPGEDGFYTLKQEYASATQNQVPGACKSDVYFVLSGEISNIYKKDGRVRKVHNVVMFPSFESVALFQQKLEKIGNIRSDGRPILGLDSHDLLEIVLETDARGVLIPAHIWTPWFSLLGSKSGFDSVEECYGDLTPHIFALETGLSTDPPMNWRLSILDKYTLVSNSDAHSPAKLAREANIFDTDMNYDAMISALKNRDGEEFSGTIEFFPEEGKYHMDGHRKCGCMMKPKETIKNNGICPVCGKPVTLGVSYRIEELADRDEGVNPATAKTFKSLIPLPEVIGEVKSVGPNSKRVQTQYRSLLKELGPELQILLNIPVSDMETAGGSLLAEGIRRMRQGLVFPQPGYDGEYGIIRLFQEGDRSRIIHQGALFAPEDIPLKEKPEKETAHTAVVPQQQPEPEAVFVQEDTTEYGLNEEQQSAVEHRGSPLIIKAGPGTGKTRTLTHRIASLIQNGEAKPEEVLAVTFTNKAAREMRDRLDVLLGKSDTAAISIKTFHAFGADFMRQNEPFFGRTSDFAILNTAEDVSFHKRFKEQFGLKLTKTALERISGLKSNNYYPGGIPKEIYEELPEKFPALYDFYENLLKDINAVDYDDLICLSLRLLRHNPDSRRRVLRQLKYIAVDEFQDINRAQYEMFQILAVSAADVCVIGDPDQAIYGFRGASREFFLRFNKDFPNARSIVLRRNYRSAQNILNASGQILGNSNVALQDKIWSDIAPDVKIKTHLSFTDRAEAEFIVHQIEQLIGGTSFFSIDSSRVDDRGLPEDYSFADIAVLLRTKRLAPPLIEALTRSGIPYDSFDESRLVSQDILNFVAASLRQIQNPAPKSIHQDIISAHFENKYSGDHTRFREYINNLNNLAGDCTVKDRIEFIWNFLDSEEMTEKNDTTTQKRKLLQLAEPFAENTGKFLDAFMLQHAIDDLETRADKVHILTLHASKGLEFPVVFIAGCEENIIPHRFPGQTTDIDEERRLLYVGMTRARQHLYLTHCKKRLISGQVTKQSPSRFLSAISESLVRRDQKEYGKKKNNQMSLF